MRRQRKKPVFPERIRPYGGQFIKEMTAQLEEMIGQCARKAPDDLKRPAAKMMATAIYMIADCIYMLEPSEHERNRFYAYTHGRIRHWTELKLLEPPSKIRPFDDDEKP